MELSAKSKALVTVVYGNDVLVNFDACLFSILTYPAILAAYG